MVDLLERLDVMLVQESTCYKTVDYLAPEFQKNLAEASDDALEVLQMPLESDASSSTASSTAISELWREKICEWCYQVIDHFDFSREVVSVAIHYLDRYLATRQVSRKIFQLAAMTSLFLAIKLYEPGRVSMASMVELSRGYFTVEQMALMETSLLRHMLFLFPHSAVSLRMRHDIMELSRFLTEISVIDYFFVIQQPSRVGLASILVAMEEVAVPPQYIEEYLSNITASLKITTDDLSACRERLRELYYRGEYAQESPDKRGDAVSPVCVTSYPR